MKCNKPFIIAYDALFKYIDNLGGEKEVLTFWRLLGEAILGPLRAKIKDRGLVGMAEYWLDTLTAEEANFSLELDSNGLCIILHECPSIRKLQEDGIKPYRRYCRHCWTLYGDLLLEMGYTFHITTKDKPKGCVIWIKPGSFCLEQEAMPLPAETS